MESSLKFFDPRDLAKLDGLELRARHIVEGYLSGAHRSPFHGFSVEFAEHREYVPGDDVRRVDWKVWGKTDKFYLKQFEEDTNLNCYLLVDVSESMRYRGELSPFSKLEYAQCVAAALAYLVLGQQDSVGLVAFDRTIRTQVQAAGGQSHFQQILGALAALQPREATAAAPVFHELAERIKRRGIIVVLSDLLDDVGTLLEGLKHLRHRRHDVIVLHTLDPAEIDFPFSGATTFKGLEAQGQVLADPQSLRVAYQNEFGEFLREVSVGCRNQGIDYQLIRTDEPFNLALNAYLAKRMAKRT